MPPADFAWEIIQIVGAGAVGAAATMVAQAALSRREREATRLERQLSELYGPLHFFITQNNALNKLIVKINEEYRSFFTGGGGGARGMDQATATIELSNSYARRMAENNGRMMEALSRSWFLVDPEDVEVLAEFQVDFVRFQNEVEAKALGGVPLTIYQALGEIHYMRPAVVERVHSKWESKQARLRALRRAFFSKNSG